MAADKGEESVSTSFPLPYDPTEGIPIPALITSDSEALASLPVKQLLELVPDPIASENRKLVELDRRLAGLRTFHQRSRCLVKGRRQRTPGDYARTYLSAIAPECPTGGSRQSLSHTSRS